MCILYHVYYCCELHVEGVEVHISLLVLYSPFYCSKSVTVLVYFICMKLLSAI